METTKQPGAGRVAGRRALVTGAASDGMGRAIALAFAREGAKVAIHYRDETDAAEAVLGMMAGLGARAAAFPADFAEPAAARAVTREAIAWLGGIDILVANAAAISRAPFLDLTDEEVARVIGVNLHGTFACAQEAARAMVAAGCGGRLVFVSSINQQKGMPLQSHYAASKGGIMQLARSMAIELAPHGITCNLIAPGAMLTDFNRHIMADEAHRRRVESAIPMGRLGRPDDVCGAALFLAGEECGYVTGTTIFVDGGRSCV